METLVERSSRREEVLFFPSWPEFIVLLLLALGEGAALGAVATDTETPVLFALTCASLATGFVAIGFVALGGPFPTGAEPADES